MKFDNHDDKIRYVGLHFYREDLKSIPAYSLPEGYRFSFYQPGDRDAWIRIEQSAKEFASYEQGLESWNRYYGGREEMLENRMVFIENEAGEKVATATAYYDIYGNDQTNAGWLHWVAVAREFQGRGLAKPLIAYTLGLMPGLGYDHAMLSSQTNTWLACKLYLDFGFVPVRENTQENELGWRILKALTDHPVLAYLEAAKEMQILSE
jgi:ribosomal protein S18 acetylase RimI-like enzyme